MIDGNQCTHLERKVQNAWDMRYNHLARDNFKKILIEKCINLKIPTVNLVDPKNIASIDVNIKNEKISKSSPNIPQTSAAMVGWRSSISIYNLELMGNLSISPKTTVKTFILSEKFENTQQKFISLG